jgi:hypothetical protein
MSNAIESKVFATWLGSSLHYKEAIENVRYEDFDVQYWGNRFSCFGNGMQESRATRIRIWRAIFVPREQIRA